MAREQQSSLAIISAIAGALFGIIVGYMLALNGVGPAAARVAPAAAPAPAAAGGVPDASLTNDADLQAWHNIIEKDPRNVKAHVELANRLYDAGKYTEAIGHYQQAFAIEPANISVSTDLGTALWYTGRADDALAQFRKSLALDPKHPQTLFNMGVVLLDGKQDAAGAIAAWEQLRAAAPASAEAGRAASMIETAKARLAPKPVRSSS